VVAEVSYMVESRVGSAAEAQFLRSLASGELELAELTRSGLTRMAEMVERYADLPLGAADASVIAIAERLGAREIATLDRRDFTVVRPSHVNARPCCQTDRHDYVMQDGEVVEFRFNV
jgi:predicted nucleic acid-binding protein